MATTQLPLWVSLLSSLGIASIVSTAISIFFTSRQQRKNWLSDNKKQEWRELINTLHEALGYMEGAFPPPNIRVHGPEATSYQSGIRMGYRVIENRIFIAASLQAEQLRDKFEELVKYAVSATCPREPNQRGCPTVTAFVIKVRVFEGEVMSAAKRDLEI
jgi:hypothetical protein